MRAGRRTLFLAALMLLVSFGALTLEESFVHTDDGCAVETHCLACRWAYGANFVAAPVPALSADLPRVGIVVTPVERVTTVETTAETPARAPPQA